MSEMDDSSLNIKEQADINPVSVFNNQPTKNYQFRRIITPIILGLVALSALTGCTLLF